MNWIWWILLTFGIIIVGLIIWGVIFIWQLKKSGYGNFAATGKKKRRLD